MPGEDHEVDTAGHGPGPRGERVAALEGEPGMLVRRVNVDARPQEPGPGRRGIRAWPLSHLHKARGLGEVNQLPTLADEGHHPEVPGCAVQKQEQAQPNRRHAVEFRDVQRYPATRFEEGEKTDLVLGAE